MAKNNYKCQGLIKDIRREEDIVFLTLGGEIDMSCSTDLRGELLVIMQEEPSLTIINMQDVHFMDSSGLAVLVETLQWSRQNQKQLKLVGLHARVRSIFEISRLDSMFEIFDSEAEAMTQ